jgi:hypothetical protein
MKLFPFFSCAYHSEAGSERTGVRRSGMPICSSLLRGTPLTGRSIIVLISQGDTWLLRPLRRERLRISSLLKGATWNEQLDLKRI